jgi:hypothetical protein
MLKMRSKSMRTPVAATIGGGTDPDLIAVAEWRARFEVGRALSKGEEPWMVRQSVIRRFREELVAESFGEYADEALMAAMQRGVEDALLQGSAN